MFSRSSPHLLHVICKMCTGRNTQTLYWWFMKNDCSLASEQEKQVHSLIEKTWISPVKGVLPDSLQVVCSLRMWDIWNHFVFTMDLPFYFCCNRKNLLLSYGCIYKKWIYHSLQYIKKYLLDQKTNKQKNSYTSFQ